MVEKPAGVSTNTLPDLRHKFVMGIVDARVDVVKTKDLRRASG
jgi:hypothetical protein